MKKTVINEDMTLEKESNSYIKIEKNTKGYNWSITLDFDRYENGSADITISEIERINNLLKIKFGGE
jgi:uncharacterized ubiquitin-like protein YukD